MKLKTAHYTIVLQPEPEGGFTVLVPALPGCVTYGRTLEEAKTMAEDAIGGFLASLKKHREPIPKDESFVTTIDLPLRYGIQTAQSHSIKGDQSAEKKRLPT